MSLSNCRSSVMSIVQKLNKIVSEESETLGGEPEDRNNEKNDQPSVLDLLRSIINNPPDSSSKQSAEIPELKILNNHWADSMGNCSLELVFLQCTVWLKNLVETTDHVPADEVMKIVESLLDEKHSKNPPASPQVPTTPQRTWPGMIQPFPAEKQQKILIPASQEIWSQQSADLFDSPPLPGDKMTLCDSGMGSSSFLARKPSENDENLDDDADEPSRKKSKTESMFIPSSILSSFLANNPFNNIGLQVIRVLFGALERKETVKGSLEYSREIKDAVDAIIGFIEAVEKEEGRYCGYVVFCIPNAVDAIKRICIDYKEDDDVEEVERMVLMSTILELCNVKDICVKTIKMIVEEVQKLAIIYDDKSKPLPPGIEHKIRGLDYCLNLVVDKFCEKFAMGCAEPRCGESRNSRTGEDLTGVLMKDLKEIYYKNRLVFPQFAFSVRKLWRRLVDKLKSN